MKHTEIGDIPVEWEIQSFKETFQILFNNTLPRADLNHRGGMVRNIHYGDILTQYSEVLNCQRDVIPYLNDTSLLTATAQLLQDGDILLADTAEDETVGKATEIYGLGNKKLVAGLHTIPCRVKKGDFTPKWLGYYMNSEIYHKQILPFVTGIKVSSISKSAIADTLIAVPPVEEQKAIVEILSDIDSCISLLKKDIEKLKYFKKAQLQAMFPRKDKKAPEVRMSGFTGDWERRKVSEICEQITDTINPADKPDDMFTEYSMPAFDNNETADVIIGKFMNSMRKVINKPCLLVNKLNVRKKRIWDVKKPENNAVCSAEFVPLVSINSDLEFLKYMLLTDGFTNYLEDCSSGTSNSQKRVTPDDIMSAKIIVPKQEEQKIIGQYFSTLDRLITLHQHKLEKYTAIKQGMMSNLLTGKIRLV